MMTQLSAPAPRPPVILEFLITTFDAVTLISPVMSSPEMTCPSLEAVTDPERVERGSDRHTPVGLVGVPTGTGHRRTVRPPGPRLGRGWVGVGATVGIGATVGVEVRVGATVVVGPTVGVAVGLAVEVGTGLTVGVAATPGSKTTST